MQSKYERHSYFSLSVKDLLEAREAYHHYLTTLNNVAATAIGLYRIRYDDPAAESPNPADFKEYGDSDIRTLENTVVRPWSWPCVLVFVNQWYGKELHKNVTKELVPKYLYLQNGKKIPTCVILLKIADEDQPKDDVRLNFPNNPAAGGYLCYTDPQDTQGIEQIGTIGGLVAKAGTTYALTNHHVAGEGNRPIYRISNGQKEKIGITVSEFSSKAKFRDVYPEWPGEFTYLKIDAGLIKVDDLNEWTSQVYGIGKVDSLKDLNCDTITLNLIGDKVKAYCGVSGLSYGEIYALFYRFKKMGGVDHVADLLIGPRTEEIKITSKSTKINKYSFNVEKGDSGSYIFLEEQSEAAKQSKSNSFTPFAMLWGGFCVETEQNNKIPFALGTFLSTVCKVLDLDLKNDHNNSYNEYWGKSGHFKIGYKFCDLLTTEPLKELFCKNRELTGFPNSKIELGKDFKIDKKGFVPLADVPDYVWISMSMYGNESNPRKNEPIQHFADIDEEDSSGGPSLLKLCGKNKNNLKAEVWYNFYKQFEDLDYGPDSGALPFRVRQIYDDMVNYLKNDKSLIHFFAAAGVLAHYVMDGAISLHLSKYNHGFAPKAKRGSPEFNKFKKSREYKIHNIYEQKMFEYYAVDLNKKIDESLDKIKASPKVDDSWGAIKYFFKLMEDAYETVDPKKLVEADKPELSDKERAAIFYNKYKEQTVNCFKAGCKTLADLVESAWKQGNGRQLLTNKKVPVFSEDKIKEIYRSGKFLPALSLEQYMKRGY